MTNACTACPLKRRLESNGASSMSRTFGSQTAIIRTLPSLYSDKRNVGYRRYVRAIRELESEIIPAIYIAMAQLPKVEVLHMYLLIEGQIRVRLNIVEYIAGTEEICWDATIRQPKYWAVCSGPVLRPPEPIKRRGFQGFRYTGDLW
jgi:hypothetical protein